MLSRTPRSPRPAPAAPAAPLARLESLLSRLEHLPLTAPADRADARDRAREEEADARWRRKDAVAALLRDEVAALREQDARNQARIRHLLCLLSEDGGAGDWEREGDAGDAWRVVDRMRQRTDSLLAASDAARLAASEQHAREVEELQGKLARARELVRDAVKEAAETRREVGEVLKRAAEEEEGRRRSEEREREREREAREREAKEREREDDAGPDTQLLAELDASRDALRRLEARNAELALLLAESRKETAELRRLRASDLDSFSGDLAVARAQLKSLRSSLAALTRPPVEDRDRVFSAKDEGRARRLADAERTAGRAGNFLSGMGAAVRSMRGEAPS